MMQQAAVRGNRRLAVALQANGLSEDASRYTYRAQILQRKALFYEGASRPGSARGRWRRGRATASGRDGPSSGASP
jgi:hypothetical protein